MITGTFTFTDNTQPAPGWTAGFSFPPCLQFFKVASTGFSGGYFTNPRLPWSADDILYEDRNSDILVLLSGTVYNRAELHIKSGIRPEMPVPALIAGLFIQQGAGFVSNLNGDFAICILQPGAKRIYLFRDHVGIRPLAYSAGKSSLVFSTDITGLSKTVSDGQDLSRTYLSGHFRYIDYRLTPSDRVKKLMPGHYLEFSDAGLRIVRYWKPEMTATERKMTHDQMISDLGAIVKDAVMIRCDRRFNAAAHVSGGLDSGIVSVLSRREYCHQEKFSGFSWSPLSFPAVKGRQDERELVEKTCKPSGITAVFSEMDRHSFPGVVSACYENHAYYSEYSTAKQASVHGVNLIFSGWGGDEFISTGAAAMEPDLLRTLHWGLYLRRNMITHPKMFLYNFVRYVLQPALGVLPRGTSRSFRDDARYLKKDYKKSDRKAIKRFYFNTSRRSHHVGMFEFYHLQERCESWYEMGFRMGIEYRYPLLDRRIIEYMFRVPSVLLCRAGESRPILREIGKGILDEDVRLSTSKSDPVYWTYMKELYREVSDSFMEEVPQWRENPDLGFIDFELLAHDICGHRSGSGTVSEEVLFRSLVYLKALHEFTLSYHESTD